MATQNGNATTQIGNTLNSLSEPSQNFLVQTENDQILDVHNAIESVSHETSLSGSLHGLTGTGESIGFGKVGDSNLITDIAQAPGDLLNGEVPGQVASGIVTDAGNSAGDAGTIVQGLGSDMSNPHLISDIANGASHEVGEIVDAAPLGDNLSDLGSLGSLGNGGSGQPIISLSGGSAGGSPILDAGVLNAAPTGSPIGIAAGSGDSLLAIDALSGSTEANGGSGDSLVSGGLGNDGNPSILSAAALGGTNGNSPIDFAAGNGANIADINALNDNGSEHLVTADGGTAGGSTLLDTGLLTTPDGQSPLNADVGNGTNIANASVLPNSDLLQFPDLGGAGTDSLTGIVPSALGATDLADITGTNGVVPVASDPALVDVHTDGGALVHIAPDPNALVGVNDHAIV